MLNGASARSVPAWWIDCVPLHPCGVPFPPPEMVMGGGRYSGHVHWRFVFEDLEREQFRMFMRMQENFIKCSQT